MACTMDSRYHDYIPEFGSSRVFIVCVMDWALP